MYKEEENNTSQVNETTNKNSSYKGNLLAGFIVIIAGTFYLLKNLGIDFPNWLFSWPMLLIIIGLFVGAKHSYSRGGWWIVCLVGAIFLFKDYINSISISHILWPIFIIFVGLIIMLKPRRKWDEKNNGYCRNRRQNNAWFDEEISSSSDDFIESTSIMGGVKKNIISKNFKGGNITCIMGGAEINLINADITEKAVIDVTQIFGGTKLIIPSNWNVVSEMTAILGGIEDRRDITQSSIEDGKKVLVLKGTSIFAGIDIRSY